MLKSPLSISGARRRAAVTKMSWAGIREHQHRQRHLYPAQHGAKVHAAAAFAAKLVLCIDVLGCFAPGDL